MTIQGVFTHEEGCPDAWKNQEIECRCCGSGFLPDTRMQKFCSPCCAASYNGHDCDCVSCQEAQEDFEE
jgi:hypothetical protein